MTDRLDDNGVSHNAVPFRVGVTVMPEWFAYEGIDAVLDRVEALGATAIATSPYVLEEAPDGIGAREPPLDAGAGSVRPLDRALFGRHALWVRTAPSFEHDFARYRGLRYQPSPPDELTRRQSDLIDNVVQRASERGVVVYLQVMAASPPGYRVQFSSANDDDACLGPDGRRHDQRVDRNASLASAHVGAYTATLVAELAQRYPDVHGFRLDWPEYPPYDFRSALFDFHPSAKALMEARGNPPSRAAFDVLAWGEALRREVVRDPSSAFDGEIWCAAFDARGPFAALREAKQDAVLALVARVRAALDALPGPRRRLELQAFPPPLHMFSGFPFDRLTGLVDAVGIKLYTMHWPMIARFWARDLVGTSLHLEDDASVALARAFGFVDARVAANELHYPEPGERHPVGERAQIAKIESAIALAGDVPVIAFAHTYGPLDDVAQRACLAASSGAPVWLNRYGYLSNAKIAALGAVL
ncbi:MAG TPA: hypothetical protein VNG69_10905 [Casimicrobiaceae bacterium]|nr:hypothetical protein [Casimicrobiaceae bacterium]